MAEQRLKESMIGAQSAAMVEVGTGPSLRTRRAGDEVEVQGLAVSPPSGQRAAAPDGREVTVESQVGGPSGPEMAVPPPPKQRATAPGGGEVAAESRTA